jgi:hypothetical protein
MNYDEWGLPRDEWGFLVDVPPKPGPCSGCGDSHDDAACPEAEYEDWRPEVQAELRADWAGAPRTHRYIR